VRHVDDEKKRDDLAGSDEASEGQQGVPDLADATRLLKKQQ